MEIFKAYDIRGVYNKEFDKNDVYKIGYFLPELLDTDKILIGYDGRKSTPEIFNYLSQGIKDKGADVHTIGDATTPLVYFGTAKYNYEGSVMITASHNPPEYNGFKISRKKALPVGYESGLKELENMVENKKIRPVSRAKKGKIIEKDIKKDYINFLKTYFFDLSNLKVVMDASNGMAALLLNDIFGTKPIYLNNKVDGTFPNHAPNPLEQENRSQLKEVVIKENADLGLIFDGDGDRVMFLDEKGEFISPDLITALLADFYLKKGENKDILYDIRTSWSVKDYIETLGGSSHMWKVGHAFAKIKLREIDGICGGELAGHYYFKDFFYCDSGLLTAVIVLSVVSKLKKENKTISEFITQIDNYNSSGEINFEIENKAETMENIKNYYIDKKNPVAFFDFDGYRIEFDKWWFNIRPSNTEPYLRLVVEAVNQDLLEKKLKEIKNIIKN